MRKPLRPRPSTDDDGFTLVEVIVALVLIGIIATAALAFFVRAMQNTSHLQRSQASVAVANQAMELVRSMDPRVVDAATGTSGLLIGRSKAETDVAWAAAPAADTAQSSKVWDPAAHLRSAADKASAIPVTTTSTVSDMEFEVTTLIGSCYRSKTASVDPQSCVKTLAGGVMMYRVTVNVTWKAGNADQCGDGTCDYSVSTLVDPTEDANWNLTARPVAYDDAITAIAGDTATLPTDVLVNDVIGSVTANPTTITVPPAFGTATTVPSNPGMGSIRYVPGNASGVTELKYKLKDAAGRQSNEATVQVTVTPKANNDATVSVPAGDTVVIDVVANDFGTNLVPVIVNDGTGTATVTGNKITFVAPSSTGSTSVKYMAQDPSGLLSAEASVPVNVTTPVVPKVGTPPPTITLPYSVVGTTANLDLLAKTGNASTFRILVTSPPSSGSVTLNAPSNNAATFNQPAGLAVGTYTFKYKVQSLSGATSPEGTYTITVTAPQAVVDTGMSLSRNTSTQEFSLGANDVPTSTAWGSVLRVTVGSSDDTRCGTVKVANAQRGTVTVTRGNRNQTCTFKFTYSLQATGGAPGSNTVTNTVTVQR